MPDEKIERIRSLLAHAHEEEKVDPSPVQDSSRMSYAASADEIERLRSLFAHAHDPGRTNPFRRVDMRFAKCQGYFSGCSQVKEEAAGEV